MNKKGLSDVITTVLIILIVIVAIGMIAAFLVPLLKGTTDKAQGVNTCLTIDVLAKKCEVAQNGVNDYDVSVLISRGVGKTEISQAKIILEKEDGSSNITNFASPNGLVEYASVSHSLARINFKPKSASVAVKLSGANNACDASEKIICKMVSSFAAGGGNNYVCTDNDPGQDTSFRGTVTITNNGAPHSTTSDLCPGGIFGPNRLTQYFCSTSNPDIPLSSTSDCANGCTNGACNPAPATDYTTGLIASWKFNEASYTGSANEVRDSQGLNHGTPTSGATLVSGGTGNGNALNLNGNNNVKINPNPTNSFSTIDSYTLSAWIKTSSNLPRNRIYGHQYNAQYYIIGLLSNKLWCPSSVSTTETLNAVYGSALNDGAWHHIACIRDSANKFYWYVDGVKEGEVSISSRYTATDQSWLGQGQGIFIGTYDGSNENYNGVMDDVRVYNTALTDQQIKDVRLANMHT